MNRSLEIPNLIVTKEEEEGGFKIVHVRSIEPVAEACNLGCKLWKNGTKTRDINDVPHYCKQPTILRFHEQRFGCADCADADGVIVGSDAVYEHVTFVQEGTWMTHRCIDYMASECVRTPFAEIARKVGVDRKTAAKAFSLRSDEIVAARKGVVPRVLGIDEIQVKKEMRAVLGDVENKAVYDMLPDRDEALERHLYELSDCRQLEVLVTDRYDPYRGMIKRRLKGRLHVTDVWHVVRHANFAIDEVRIRISKSLSNRRMGVALRNSKKLFHLRWHDATVEERASLVQWFKLFPVLAEAYWTKERYFELYLCQSTAEAEAYYKHWLSRLPGSVSDSFERHCAIPRRWMPMLIAYFEEPYTTGYIESVNRFIADQDRDGRGYSFDVMRAKFLLREPLADLTFRPKTHLSPPSRKRRVITPDDRALRDLQRGHHEPMVLRTTHAWSHRPGSFSISLRGLDLPYPPDIAPQMEAAMEALRNLKPTGSYVAGRCDFNRPFP
ncbi:transposase [Methylobacterium sp.]|uniref:transposase n=1 Tax=Methylobacterium sp. TaxID=409 RepID=UPI00257F5F80|nr:transposase [Methylobacterium sp.]